jgi:hypothetical protein
MVMDNRDAAVPHVARVELRGWASNETRRITIVMGSGRRLPATLNRRGHDQRWIGFDRRLFDRKPLDDIEMRRRIADQALAWLAAAATPAESSTQA